MAKLAALIEENKELLATIDAWDNGMRFIFSDAAPSEVWRAAMLTNDQGNPTP